MKNFILKFSFVRLFLLAALTFLLTLLFGGSVFAATYTVTNTNNNGAGSFRQAILDANGNAGLDTIDFNIPGAGLQTIQPLTPLPAILDPVILDAYTQPGAQANTQAAPLVSDAVLLIELDGSVAGAGNGLRLSAGGSTIRGLIINNWANNGIRIFTNGNNTIEGNYIGTDSSGTIALPNGSDGIIITDATNTNNIIGGNTPTARNVISGNTNNGINITNGSNNNVISGNFIGTDYSGTLDLGNTFNGIRIIDSPTNIVGGTTAAERNIISGNDNIGVNLNGAATTGCSVQGNYIGTDVTGSLNLGNSQDNLRIANGATSNLIGGVAAGEANVIAYSGDNGVSVQGAATVSNSIRANSIHSNTNLGIDLRGNGVTANDNQDPDANANNQQNYPVITSLLYNSVTNNTTVTGTLNSTPLSNFDIDFFANTSIDPTGYGEGQTYLGSVNVSTDALGDSSVSGVFAGDLSSAFISMTATDTVTFDTSEFSKIDSVDLLITKTVDVPSPIPYQTINFTITVTNNGPDTATGITVTDIIPGSLTYQSDTPSQGTYTSATGIWNIGSLTSLSSATLQINAKVNSGACGAATNTTTIKSIDQPDTDTSNNSASQALTYPACPPPPPVAGGYREGIKVKNGKLVIEDQEGTTTTEEEKTSKKDFCTNFVFEPENKNEVMRYEFIKMMLEFNCYEVVDSVNVKGSEFNDYKRQQYEDKKIDLAVNSMYTAFDKGFIDGYSDSTVKPFNPILLSEAAKVVYLISGESDESFKAQTKNLPATLEKGQWYVKYMLYLMDLTNHETLDPGANLTKDFALEITDLVLKKNAI
ncbi:DUF11 domain-containing protein [Candidatus Peregrinibacteria bacterium]|nr:DUF11 domain-containing protein [Candidatus Peregrinibacteria bacterium]